MGFKFINPDAFKNAINLLNEGKIGLLDGKDFMVSYTETEPIEGYEKPLTFPNSIEFHKMVYDGAKEKLKEFPNCCDEHRKLLQTDWFKKEEFIGMPKKVMFTLYYTEYHITKRIDNGDWYKDITNYILYSLLSFGQLPTGYGPPLGLDIYTNSLTDWINGHETINAEKKAALIEYINGYGKISKDVEKRDIIVLLEIYEKWLKIFPFGISYFSKLRQTFEKKYPFFEPATGNNIYIPSSGLRMVTQKNLIRKLAERTNLLLKCIETKELINEGLIKDINTHRIELLNETHRIRQNSLIGDYSKGEMEYVKVLEKWLSNEKEYFEEFAKIRKEPTQIITKNDINENTESGNEEKAITLLTLNEIAKQENIFWKGIPMDVVVKHFKVLAERKNKKGEYFLTHEQLIKFLSKAFLGKTEFPKQKINLTYGEKGFVIKKFHEFFELAVTEYREMNEKSKYIKIVTDSFDNWDFKTIESLFKPNKTKKRW